MSNRIFEKSNRYHYRRYFLVLILFVLTFMFGKNMGVISPEQKQLQNLKDTLQKNTSGIYSVSANQHEFTVSKLFSIGKGQCGRLFFDLKDISTVDESQGSSMKSLNVKIFLSNNFNQTKELGTYQIRNDKFVQNEKAEFCADEDYSDLIFQKGEDAPVGSFEISNISFFSLPSEKHDFNNTQTSIVGETDFSKATFQSDLSLEDATVALKFTRTNQVIGQTFMANSDMMSGVDLKMEFAGVGGIGNYYLELREFNDQNGKISLSTDRIAYYQFNKDNAGKNLQVEDGIYHIPLAAHLEKGKTYFIGINNAEVKFNILNTLKIYGSNTNSHAGKIIASVGGKTSGKTGSLFLRIYGAEFIKVDNEKVLTNAKIMDNGDGTGQYIYEQKGNPSDYLDLEQVVSKENTSIFYDNIQGGISGRDEDDNAFIYKINTIYPFARIKVEAQQSNSVFINSLVYYSFDNINWTEIKNDLAKDELLQEGDANKFQELLQGNGKTKTIYIKVTYDKEDAQEKATSATPVHLFGLKNLKVVAELTISK